MNSLFFMGLCLLGTGSFWYTFNLFRESRKLRKTSLLLRTSLLTLLIYLSLETIQSMFSFPDPLFVLLDTSASMKRAAIGTVQEETWYASLE